MCCVAVSCHVMSSRATQKQRTIDFDRPHCQRRQYRVYVCVCVSLSFLFSSLLLLILILSGFDIDIDIDATCHSLFSKRHCRHLSLLMCVCVCVCVFVFLIWRICIVPISLSFLFYSLFSDLAWPIEQTPHHTTTPHKKTVLLVQSTSFCSV